MPLLFSTVLEVLARAIIRQDKELKGIQIRMEEVKLPLFADDIILYAENPKDPTKKLLELINNLSKVIGYKTNTQKSVLFYIKNKLSEKEIKKTIPSTTESKRIIIPGINLTKEVKDLYTENNKILMKESEDKINGKIFQAHSL